MWVVEEGGGEGMVEIVLLVLGSFFKKDEGNDLVSLGALKSLSIRPKSPL